MINSKKGNVMFEFGEGTINLIIAIVSIVAIFALVKGFSNTVGSSDTVTPIAKGVAVAGYNVLVNTINYVFPILYLILIFISVNYVKNMETSKVEIVVMFLIIISFIGALLMLPSNITGILYSTSPLIASVLDDMPIAYYMIDNSLFFGILYLGICGNALIARDRP